MKEQDEAFSDLNRKEKTLVISSISLLIFLALAFIFFVYVGVFHLTGVEYTSRTALLLFFILSLALDIFSSFGIGLCKIFFSAPLNQMPKWLSFLLLAILQISFDWITIHITDEWIDGVTISNIGELLIVLTFFTIDKLWITDKKNK
ncbi:regulatory YrvL family protein [Bacillus sp. 123MFChir2]|uniref:regulatory YrvL family protein n=1 Tax=Bacillus sp. 123MFChir2 TaxID=1169144 RepID=UPI000371610E|nr:regulatory YrvL family protein [Bacillus sp. 123MFChir2]